MKSASIFRPDRIPSLNRLPQEVGRKQRLCERCNQRTEHILYVVPKKVAIFFYRREHPDNVHATCVECAHSVVLTGEEREQALNRI